jgi:hypothetical protein
MVLSLGERAFVTDGAKLELRTGGIGRGALHEDVDRIAAV